MIASNTTFPKFVPDQLLTSENLNNFFGYLDEQGRLTRVNLIGIGIVCGLEVKPSSDGSSITITKGVGITSEGYLVNFPETEYTDAKVYDPVKPVYYNRFVDLSDKTQKMDLWELKQEAVEEETTKISDINLENKVVLIFVELLEEQNKNCDPDSCDDKGVTVTVTFRPLLVSKNESAFNTLIGKIGQPIEANTYLSLPTLKIPRFDVANTDPVTTVDFFKAYLQIINQSFISKVQSTLSEAYTAFENYIDLEYPSNPFSGLGSKFNFLFNGSISGPTLLTVQYYYDFFADLIRTYDDFRILSGDILSLCSPDSTLFPRHLLLGEAMPNGNKVSDFRHYFIYSPLFERKNLLLELRFLFKKMVAMLDNLDLPPFKPGNIDLSEPIRITPEKYGNVPLSEKAIPYYYNPDSIYRRWSFEKTSREKENENLSYHAASYNQPTTEDNEPFRKPAKFDLEPFGFLRVEGYLGKNISSVMNEINEQIEDYRLPFKAIALKAGTAKLSGLSEYLQDININDLEISYDIARREWEGVIGKTIEYLNDVKDEAINLTDTSQPGRLVNFIKLLVSSKKYMYDSLPEFAKDYEAFIPVYEDIEEESQSLSVKLEERLKTLDPVKDRDRYNLAEDLIDHLDGVVFSTLKGPFRALYQEFNRRLEDIYSNIYFSNFAKKNPGIQHKAGVTMGGTLILVYHEPDKSKPNDVISQLVSGLSKNSVIGDFFLPYTCCSNGAPINLTINELPPEPNQGPIADAGPDQVLEPGATEATLDGTSSSDSDGTITSYQWAKISGPSADIADANSAATNVSNLVTGTYTFQLIVTDDKEASDQDTVQITVRPIPNDGPIANAGPDRSLNAGVTAVTLDGSSSTDSDGTIETYTWTQTGGPNTAKIDNPENVVVNVSDLVPGTYVFRLTVKDDQGASDQDTVTIIVLEDTNEGPIAEAGDNKTLDLGATEVTLDGSASYDPDGSITKYFWKQTAGPVKVLIETPDNVRTKITRLTPGNYEFQLTVTDDKGISNLDKVSVIVPSQKEVPIAKAGPDQTIKDGSIEVILDGRESKDPQGGKLTFLWKQVSGPNESFIKNPDMINTYVYELIAGVYEFQLTVTNDKGISDQDHVIIKVLS